MDFLSLRNQYPRFDYKGFHIDSSPSAIRIIYSFSIDGLSDFHPCWTIPLSGAPQNDDEAAIYNLAFHLGLVELVSYWKITCSPQVYIHPQFLSDDQIAWWKKLYFRGLGEFFFINNIQTDIGNFMTIHNLCAPSSRTQASARTARLQGNLIPVGGGKDSAVTLELLKPQRLHNICYMVNRTEARLGTAVTAGYPEERTLVAGRTLDPNMLRLNRQGFLNGHTPLSAIIAFSGALAAYLYGKKYVVLSNESSANDDTVTGAEVNHQYSKSYEFEADFSAYLRDHLNCGVRYFSLLRPVSELQIASFFSGLKPYHTVFNSCNLGSKTDSWCLKCPKCLFVYIILSPFLSLSELNEIFGANLLEDPAFLNDFEQLTGQQANKPFECVGSREEVNIAVNLAIRRMRRDQEPIPYLYRLFMENAALFPLPEDQLHFRSHWDSRHLIPPEYAALLEQSGMYDSRGTEC